MCLRSEDAGGKTDSVAENIIVDRADFRTRIKITHLIVEWRLKEDVFLKWLLSPVIVLVAYVKCRGRR